MARTTEAETEAEVQETEAEDAGQAEVQEKVTEAEEKGYEGHKPRLEGENPVPNSAYSLEGGAPKDGDNPENSRVHPDKKSEAVG